MSSHVTGHLDALTIFTARKIITMDPSLPEATAVAVSGGRIVAWTPWSPG